MRTKNAVVVAMLIAGLLSFTTGTAAQQGSTQAAPTKTCTLKVSGMTCAGCATAVKIAANKVDGVTDVTVTYEKGQAVVTYNPTKTTPEAIAKAVTDNSGFKAEVVTEAPPKKSE
jgi:periplasmic mercuric ion binding protein